MKKRERRRGPLSVLYYVIGKGVCLVAKEFAKAFYRSKEWQGVRDYCLRRDKYLCQVCGRPAEEVHHKVHLTPANIMDTRVTMNPDNLVSLCRSCHADQHRDDRTAGRSRHEMTDVLPKIVFDESGQAMAAPPASNP